MRKEQYIIKGMTCSACSATVQNNVSKKDGVKVCNVNLLTEKMDIERASIEILSELRMFSSSNTFEI